MSSEIIPVVSAGIALFGVLCGSFATYLANSKIKEIELRQQLVNEQNRDKRETYSKFLSEVNSTALLSLKDKSDSHEKLQKAAALLSQVELIADPNVYNKAVDLFEVLIHMFTAEPSDTERTFSDSRTLFVAVARAELKTGI